MTTQLRNQQRRKYLPTPIFCPSLEGQNIIRDENKNILRSQSISTDLTFILEHWRYNRFSLKDRPYKQLI